MTKLGRMAAAVLLAVVAAGPARGDAPKDLALGYHVYAGGFHALTFETLVSLGPEAYAVRLKARSDPVRIWTLDEI